MNRRLTILLIFAATLGLAGNARMFNAATLSVIYGDPVEMRFNDYGEALPEAVISFGVVVFELVAVTLGVISLRHNQPVSLSQHHIRIAQDSEKNNG